MNAERYATPLPQLTEGVATLAARVDGHLKKMGVIYENGFESGFLLPTTVG